MNRPLCKYELSQITKFDDGIKETQYVDYFFAPITDSLEDIFDAMKISSTEYIVSSCVRQTLYATGDSELAYMVTEPYVLSEEQSNPLYGDWVLREAR